MEGHGHDPVRQVKGFLYAVTVVNVDVNVENPGVVPESHVERWGEKNKHGKHSLLLVMVMMTGVPLLEQLQDANDDIIDVAKARCLRAEKPENLYTVYIQTLSSNICLSHFRSEQLLESLFDCTRCEVYIRNSTQHSALTSNFLAWCKPPAQLMAMSQIWKTFNK